MKVLVVSEPGVDGVFRYVENLCHFLREQGVAVHLAYSDRRASNRLFDLVQWVRDRGGAVVNLHTANRPQLSDVSAFWSLLRTVQTVKPDVIHSHSSKAGFLARALRLLGVKAVQVYHPHAYVGMRPRPGRFDAVYNAIEGVLGRIAYTVAVSCGERQFACERLHVPISRVHLVQNGVDTERFVPPTIQEKYERRLDFGLPLDRPILGFIARSSEQKDPVTLYRAFGQVAAKHPVALFHVGTGELDGELEKVVDELGIRDLVFRRDYLTEPGDFYRAVDGFILTSRYEGLSLAAIEALSMNLPLILSDVAGNADLLAQPLSHTWAAAPGDVDGFARAITEWRDRVGDSVPCNHRQIAIQRFNTNKTFGAILGLYRELLGWSV